MSETSMIPETYQQWRDCITIRCGIPLTDDFIRSRLIELRNEQHPKTAEFAKMFGREYLHQVIEWFEQAGKP